MRLVRTLPYLVVFCVLPLAPSVVIWMKSPLSCFGGCIHSAPPESASLDLSLEELLDERRGFLNC